MTDIEEALDAPNRMAELEGEPFKTNSLVGSFFHADEGRGWQGYVVAEPAPGIYLVELFSWLSGSSTHQCLARIEDMSDWLFYDTSAWMADAYEHGVKQRWEQARASN